MEQKWMLGAPDACFSNCFVVKLFFKGATRFISSM